MRLPQGLTAAVERLVADRRPAWPLAIARVLIGLTILLWSVTLLFEVPGLLAAAGLGGDEAALADLEAWFAAAELCEVGSLGESVRPWVERLHAEAKVGRLACQLLRADLEEAAQVAPILYLMWPVRGTHHQVLGGRGSLVPALGQDRHSRWTASGTSMRAGDHLVDRLVAAVFARLP